MSKKWTFFWTLIRAVCFSVVIDIFIFATAIIFYLTGHAIKTGLKLTDHQIVVSAITVGIAMGITSITTYCLVENGKLEYGKARWMSVLIIFIVWLYTIS